MILFFANFLSMGNRHLCPKIYTEVTSKNFKVQFIVPAVNELTDQVKSYVTRELRSLHDVELVERDPNLDSFLISIYPIAVKLSNGINAGIVVSFVFMKGELIHHAVVMGSPDDLKVMCESIIAHFDTQWLEPRRHK